MIITKTPFRISFAGGGSDMADFYKNNGGCVLSASIDKYMYIMIHPYFHAGQTVLKYSENERVNNINDVRHSIFRCVLNAMKIDGVEITSTADVPSGTGLGSSSAFTVGLLHTLYCYKGKFVSKAQLAEEACDVEIRQLGAPIGKQDQYAAAFGGLNFIEFYADDGVSVNPLIVKGTTAKNLQKRLVMFYTGLTHSANDILTTQKKNLQSMDKVNNLKEMCRLAREMKTALEKNDINDFGAMLDEGWQRKRELADGVTNPVIDELYDKAIKGGALGGKLLGAGGGGFLLFYCPEEKQDYLKNQLPLTPFPFNFEHNGSSVIYIGDKYWE